VRQLSPASESASPVPGEKPTDWVQKDCGTWMKSGGVRVAMLGDVVILEDRRGISGTALTKRQKMYMGKTGTISKAPKTTASYVTS